MPSAQLITILPVAKALTLAAHARDDATLAHCNRMTHACAVIGDALGLDEIALDRLRIGAMLHDVGKCSIPDAILFKPGRLDPEEIRLMTRHSEAGHDLLKRFGHPWLDHAAEIALHHHERHDGSGYPKGLAGHVIPAHARIVAITDVYDALRSDRPYKAGIGHDDAMDIITRGDDRTCPGHFDPDVLTAFATQGERIRRIYEMPETLVA